MRSTIVGQIKRSHFYRFVRYVAHGFQSPEWVVQQNNEMSFYASCGVEKGVLCFDVGANVGDKTRHLRELGARVVAVEPVPQCIESLRLAFSNDLGGVSVVGKAVGANPGVLPLHVGDSSTISSLNPDWIARNGRLKGRQVSEIVNVEVTTLDALIREFGMPTFCKIDVEGYEAEVLKGLTSKIPAISFEFVPDNLSSVIECMRELSRIGDYIYNYTYSSPMRFELAQFADDQTLLHSLEAGRQKDGSLRWGDIVARLCDSNQQ